MKRILIIFFCLFVFKNLNAFSSTDSTKTEKVVSNVEIFKINKLHFSDTSLVHTTLLDPEEDLFTPSFFAVNSGLYKFPVLLNTDDFGWKSKYFMMVLDSVDYKMDTVPILTAKYDHGYSTTHWFTADFKRAIGKSKISAKFNRNASEPLYNNTRGVRNNFGFGSELPFRNNWTMRFSYFRNQAVVDENGGIYNPDSLAVVDEFNIANIFSNLNTAQSNVFEQRATLENDFKLLNKADTNSLKRTFLDLVITSSLERNKYDFSLSERDIDSAFFENNYLDSTSTFDSVGYEKIEIQPELFFGKRDNSSASKLSIGAKKEWHNFNFLNNSFAFLKAHLWNNKRSYGLEGKYHFENYWEGNYAIEGYGVWNLAKKLSQDSTIYHSKIKLSCNFSETTPSYLFLNFFGNHYQWDNSFEPIQRIKVNSLADLSKYNTIVEVEIQNLSNYIYLNESSIPTQYKNGINTSKVHIKNEIGNSWIKLHTGLIFQNSSNEIIRIPNLVTRSTLSLNFNYRTVPFILGSTFNYFSKYKGVNYNPNLRHYHLGSQTVGGTPVVDWFFAARIGPADLYVKYDNSFYLLNRNLFLGDNYPIYKQYLRFGLKWKLKN